MKKRETVKGMQINETNIRKNLKENERCGKNKNFRDNEVPLTIKRKANESKLRNNK